MDKLRILALHGYHGSAAILQSQLRPLAEASSPLADFVYVDAPSLANGDFGWWHASGKEGSIRYQGWSRTRDWLKQLCATKGPFDGVFGFSQGAALTALLVGLCAAEPRRPEAQLHFDFAMLVGGFASGDARHAPLYEALRGHELPTLHLIGRSDSIVSSTRSHALARRFESPLILEHDGGHVIAATPPIRRDVHAFLERMAQRRRLRREGRAGRTATAVAQAARRPTSASPSQSSPPWQSSPHYSQSPSYSSSPSHSPSRLSSPSPSPSSYSSSPSQGPSRLSSPSPSSPSYSSSRSQSGSHRAARRAARRAVVERARASGLAHPLADRRARRVFAGAARLPRRRLRHRSRQRGRHRRVGCAARPHRRRSRIRHARHAAVIPRRVCRRGARHAARPQARRRMGHRSRARRRRRLFRRRPPGVAVEHAAGLRAREWSSRSSWAKEDRARGSTRTVWRDLSSEWTPKSWFVRSGDC